MTKSQPTLRPILLWTSVIVSALGLCWLVAEGVGIWRTHALLTRIGWSASLRDMGLMHRDGPETTLHRVTRYLLVPRSLTGVPNRSVAVIALWQCGAPAVPVFRRALREQDAATRLVAAVGLEKAFTKVLIDENGRLDGNMEMAIEDLMQIASADPDPEVRRAAELALFCARYDTPKEEDNQAR